MGIPESRLVASGRGANKFSQLPGVLQEKPIFHINEAEKSLCVSAKINTANKHTIMRRGGNREAYHTNLREVEERSWDVGSDKPHTKIAKIHSRPEPSGDPIEGSRNDHCTLCACLK